MKILKKVLAIIIISFMMTTILVRCDKNTINTSLRVVERKPVNG